MQSNDIQRRISNDKNFIVIQFCFLFCIQRKISYFAFLFKNKQRSVNEALTFSLNRLFYLYSTSRSLANHRAESLSSIIVDHLMCPLFLYAADL